VTFSDSSYVEGTKDFIEKWSWNFGDPGSGSNTSSLPKPKHCYANTGTYDVSLTVTSNHGCVSSLATPKMIKVFAIPTAEFYPTPNPASVLNPVVQLMNGSSEDVVYWNYHFGDGDSVSPNVPSPVHKYPEIANSTYTATLLVKNKDGCVNSVEHLIEIGPEFTFYIPNAFTPDGDNINDRFSGKGIGIVTYDFTIFDRWGNLIFHSTKLEDQWDGRSNGGEEISQQDVYVWKVKLTDCFGKKHNYIGTVTLVK
jgi:gliding motility-associated-like protein